MIFIGLEISSIASYILAGYLRDDARNNESALKYFLWVPLRRRSCCMASPGSTAPRASTNLTEIRGALTSGAAAGRR